jgi:hypothetical protein
MPGFLVRCYSCLRAWRICTARHAVATLKAGGLPVITAASPMTVFGCASPRPPAGTGPCVSATWVTSSARIRVQGVPVICMDSLSVAAPTGTPLAVIATQTRVKGS